MDLHLRAIPGRASVGDVWALAGTERASTAAGKASEAAGRKGDEKKNSQRLAI